MPSGQRRTADDRRRDVLQAAITEFGTFGYYGGSTERIAAAAEISQPYVLRLFGTKLALFLATMEQVSTDILETWKSVAEKSDAKGMSLLRQFGEIYGHTPNAGMHFRVVMQAAGASEVPEVEEALNAQMDMLWTFVSNASGATEAEVQRFWAYGMMQTIGVAMNAEKFVETSTRARLMISPPELI